MVTTKEDFRRVIGHFATGVTVITASDEAGDHGATASAVSSLSLEPPMLLVCLNMKSGTQEVIRSRRAFGVNILNEDQGALAERFATPGAAKFEGTTILRGELGVPLLDGALAYCECRVVEDVTAGTHRVFLAEVVDAVAGEGTPLTYFRGQFGRFETAEDRTVHGELRGRILGRAMSAGTRVDLGELAQQFAARPSVIYHAVSKLVTEGLLGRDPERGYFVKPITVEASDESHDARCAIELGVAALTVGRVSAAEVGRLRTLMEQTEPLVAEGRFVDVEAYTRLNAAFHTGLVDLAGNPSLLEAYDRLGIPGLMVSLLKPDSEIDPELVADHRRLVEAYEAGDLPRALEVIRLHNEHAKETSRRAIRSAGGQL
jgi:flavin reductase (DIM6/NTAB) family NADH-FMN oxidoreductase RutF/DNA-binding GntR family transcriptional regulator